MIIWRTTLPASWAFASTRAGKLAVTAARITGDTRGWSMNPTASLNGLGTGLLAWSPIKDIRSLTGSELEPPFKTLIIDCIRSGEAGVLLLVFSPKIPAMPSQKLPEVGVSVVVESTPRRPKRVDIRFAWVVGGCVVVPNNRPATPSIILFCVVVSTVVVVVSPPNNPPITPPIASIIFVVGAAVVVVVVGLNIESNIPNILSCCCGAGLPWPLLTAITTSTTHNIFLL